MSGIIKGFLLLALLVCISSAQPNESKQSCLCQRVRSRILKSDLKDIQIYPATVFCDKVEIVVTASDGFRFCLNPKLKTVQKLMANILSRKNTTTTTTRPDFTSSPGSTA